MNHATAAVEGATAASDPPDAAGHGHHRAPATGSALAALALGALGVVYGDIGTSPLYALKECFSPGHGVPVTKATVLGVLSLVFWAMNFVVSFKYISLVMRADNRGEGGILALMALVRRPAKAKSKRRYILLALGLFGAALLYGDGVITPAISVLGAMEGLGVASPAFERLVVPLSVVILFGLFLVQKHGTARVGAIFGPVMLVWFACIAALGVGGILRHPSVVEAVNPLHAVRFFAEHGLHGFFILGSVVLVVTGGEALYADMGHFGRRPIRLAWFSVALPALTLNYMGQGALLLEDPAAAAANPFYALVPRWFLYPMVVVATSAAVVASQALISGAFSLTRQAVQLGYSPRVTIVHTSRTEEGQIYIPQVNTALMVACLGLVVAFRSSGNLAAAYGIAVTGTMTITSLLFHRVARDLWNWPSHWSAALTAVFLTVDLAFFGANLIKVHEGGWFPLVVAAGIYTLMITWKQGRKLLTAAMRETALPVDAFLADLARRQPTRVPGCAVFMTSDTTGMPPVLLHHLKHNKVLHEKVLLMSVQTRDVPQVPEVERLQLTVLGQGFYQVVAAYGFMETPDIPSVVRALAPLGLPLKPLDTTYYLGRETVLPTGPARMARWRKRLFIVMSRNAQSATQFFGLPPNRVVEMGAQIQL